MDWIHQGTDSQAKWCQIVPKQHQNFISHGRVVDFFLGAFYLLNQYFCTIIFLRIFFLCLQAAAASISVKSEPAAHFMTTEEKKASALCSIGKGKRSKQVRRRVQEPFRTQQIIVNDNRPHVKPELTENVDPNDLLEKVITSK